MTGPNTRVGASKQTFETMVREAIIAKITVKVEIVPTRVGRGVQRPTVLKTTQNYTKLHKTTQNYTKLHKTTQNYSKLHK